MATQACMTQAQRPVLGNDEMLSHFQERAEECAMRIQASTSASVRHEYLRIFDRWMKLIAEEQDRLARMDKLRGRRLAQF